MISLRYHVVSIAAVFLALALGVILGSSTLSNTVLSGLSDQKSDLSRKLADSEAKSNALQAKLDGADRFAASIGPSAIKGSLDKRTVAVITTEDARPEDRDALNSKIKQAGGNVTTQLQLTKSFGDPAKADQLRDLVTRVLPAGVKLPTASDPGTIAGGLIGPLVLLNKDNKPQANPQETNSAIAALSDGGFVSTSGDVRPAQLAVVLTGGAQQGDSAGDRASTLARFATQVDRSGTGTVLAGTSGSAEGSGAVGVVRADTAATSILSTVDDVDSAQGQLATVMALVEQLNGKAGQYGNAGSAKAPAPLSGQGS